ncbi:MAG: leucine--tRNA ligase [Patescibacteria group bacterium]|nr:leucine--tRNA ligase [Patescibacteria group bacterium]
MAKAYDHQAIEKKWQQRWAAEKLYETPDAVNGKENFYALVEFPYPSGDLHVGHWYAFSVPDAFARMKRMQGANVLFPIGFDAFGLPAENAAIKRNINPAEWIAESVERMRTQLESMGNSFDWSRMLVTSSPEYLRWTQWLFLKFYEKGLAYRGKGTVNWCPEDQTVLANEQVIDGKCERCGSEVVQKELEQWFFKITDYAERLLADLDGLEWPNAIKESQRNWIGKSEGALISFQLSAPRFERGENSVEVFTTRPDTLFGATYLVLAPEHPFVAEAAASNRTEVDAYVAAARAKKDIERMAEGKEKTGVELQGVSAINPATGEHIPVWTADYVLASYGTGSIMGVPAHDERDRAFAEKFGLAIRPVIAEGILVNSGDFDGLDETEGKQEMTKAFGKAKTTYKLRDWLISRQRYWGAPIPIVYDPEGNPHPVPEEHLPWLLPTDADIKPKGTSPLGSSKELKERVEKLFGAGWTPETDTMDGFVDNSWYFLRYLDPKNERAFSPLDLQKAWMPIKRYSGGAEHTTVHVLYSRFFTKALYDMGLATVAEPFKERMNRGIILAEDGRKMSKRWGNVVNPDEQVANVGADAVRTYLAFIGPYNEVGAYPWSTNGLVGVRRFLERVAELADRISGEAKPLPKLDTLLHQTVQKVGADIESMKFNTAVSALMILSNELQKLDTVPHDAYETLLKLLAPFAPHLTEELWEALGHNTSIHAENWPSFDPEKLTHDMATVVVQVAGKTRGTVSVPREASEEAVLEAARGDTKLAGHLPAAPKRVVYVPGKVLNLIP